MDIVEGLGAAFIGILVISAITQVAFSYSLQVISEKNELPDFAAFMSWIPVLNIYPLIRCGGGDFKKFVFGIIGFVVLAVGAAAVSAQAGGLVVGIAAGVMSLVALFYMASILMATAERRGVAKWFGLLSFVPIVNFFVYPYIAFHDGFEPPNKVGLVIGLLLALGPIPGQMAMVDTFKDSYAEYQQKADNTRMEAPDSVSLDFAMDSALSGASSAVEITSQLAMLDGMDPSNPDQARTMRNQIGELRGKIRQVEGADGSTVTEMEDALNTVEMRMAAADAANPDPTNPDTLVGDRTGRPTPPAARTHPPALTASVGRDADQGFAVPEAPDCPPDAVQNGAAPPEGLRRWCEKTGADAGIKHGWLTEWYETGQPALAGEYRDGLRVGVWTRWYQDGTKRVQAQFEDGMQDGAMLAWDPSGRMVHESSFTHGGPASR